MADEAKKTKTRKKKKKPAPAHHLKPETLDEYMCIHEPPMEETDKQKIRYMCGISGGVEKFLARNLAGPWQGRDRYEHMRGLARELAIAYPECQNLRTLMGQMFVIDATRANIPRLRPSQSADRQTCILGMLDADQAQFREQMRAGIAALTGLPGVYWYYYRDFCNLIFVFSAYQAPARSSPAQALADSEGKTDLWTEFLNTV
jgi:hypothetical protein